jgi:hypothetical protein
MSSVSITTIDSSPVHLAGSLPCRVLKVRARDLGDAQRKYTRIQRERDESGTNPSDVAVILEIEMHIADDARTARHELAAAGVNAPATVSYVGSGRGLAGLIIDIASASVSDGVLLRTMARSSTGSVWKRVVSDVLPLLRDELVFAIDSPPSSLPCIHDRSPSCSAELITSTCLLGE